MKANKNSEYRDGTLYSSLMAADKPCPQLQPSLDGTAFKVFQEVGWNSKSKQT